MLPRRRRNTEVTHPRLHARNTTGAVELQDAVEGRHVQKNAFGVRHGAGAESGPCAARDYGYLQALAQAHDFLHLLDRFGNDRGQGNVAVKKKPIALVGAQRPLIGNDATSRQNLLQFLQEFRRYTTG